MQKQHRRTAEKKSRRIHYVYLYPDRYHERSDDHRRLRPDGDAAYHLHQRGLFHHHAVLYLRHLRRHPRDLRKALQQRVYLCGGQPGPGPHRSFCSGRCCHEQLCAALYGCLLVLHPRYPDHRFRRRKQEERHRDRRCGAGRHSGRAGTDHRRLLRDPPLRAGCQLWHSHRPLLY